MNDDFYDILSETVKKYRNKAPKNYEIIEL